MKTMRQYHVGVAAEAFAAGLFAHSGCDVLVQYGANQPQYDLTISRDGRAIHVSVKGSQDGGWGLNQGFKKNRTYHEAVDAWVAAHKNRGIVYCFVQFQGIKLGECPRVYLATIEEVAIQLKTLEMALVRPFFGRTLVTRGALQKGV
jgi:hypothetical protein